MAAIGIRAKVQRSFFDRENVMKSIRADERRYMARTGARGMWLMRNSIRAKLKRRRIYKKGMSPEEYARLSIEEQKRVASRPGEPPRGKIFKKSIFFAFDSGRRSVVIGPVAFRKSNRVPMVLESGGRINTQFWAPGGKRIKAIVSIAPRPFKEPVLKKLKAEVPSIIRSSIRKF